MSTRKNALLLALADFVLRSGYQIGKTPVLPVYAASLGADEILLGVIVGVSTMTGMVAKPLFGALSDHFRRRLMLFVAVAVFCVVPFFYLLVNTPAQLIGIRLVHGFATAILGPVSVATILVLSEHNRAERLGWFEMARGISHIVGPLVGGMLLLVLLPKYIFCVIGLISLIAIFPILALSDGGATRRDSSPLLPRIAKGWKDSLSSGSVWLSGSLELTMFLGLYAARAFLPVYLVAEGHSVAIAGAFFALQEAAHMLIKPLGGRFGDRFGSLGAIAVGMFLLGGALTVFSVDSPVTTMLLLALVIGAGEALITPNCASLITDHLSSVGAVGAGIGMLGSFRNAGKVAGPILAGLLIARFGFNQTFLMVGSAIMLGSGLIVFVPRLKLVRVPSSPRGVPK